MREEEESLSEYLDGRMPPVARAAFEARLGASPALARRARLALASRAALRATAPRMPADLKAALKREARSRVERVPRGLAVLMGWSFSPWTFGVGAAFAAAALVLAGRLALTPRAPRGVAGSARAPEVAARMAEVSSDLWTDDDGSDRGD